MEQIFQKITQIDDSVNSQEEFDMCAYGGADKLLHANSYEDCLFATTVENEYVSELFYFLEGNSETILHQDNMVLHKLDGIMFVLIDNHEEQDIVILKKDKETIENFI